MSFLLKKGNVIIKLNSEQGNWTTLSSRVRKLADVAAEDRVLSLHLFVSIIGNYTVTFCLDALDSPFLIIMQDLVEILTDTRLLLRGQLGEE